MEMNSRRGDDIGSVTFPNVAFGFRVKGGGIADDDGVEDTHGRGD